MLFKYIIPSISNFVIAANQVKVKSKMVSLRNTYDLIYAVASNNNNKMDHSTY